MTLLTGTRGEGDADGAEHMVHSVDNGVPDWSAPGSRRCCVAYAAVPA